MSVNIVVPEVGESVVDARVAKWLKREGETVEAGEPVVELETDKIDVEVPAPKKGVLRSIAHQDGADVKIGDVLGTIDEDGAKGVRSESPPVRGSEGPTAAAKPNGKPAPATPSARKLAREQDVSLADVKTEGPRVTKADVEKHPSARPEGGLAQGPSTRPEAGLAQGRPKGEGSRPNEAPRASRLAPQAAQAKPLAPDHRTVGPSDLRTASGRSEERVRMSKRRATIARRLVEAQQTAAMLTTFNEVDMGAVMQLRERQKEAFKAKHGVGLGVASFFVKATVAALKDFPRLNAEIQGDEMVLKHYYDIGVAVSAEEGLVVPVLRDADRMSFAEIEQGIRAFAAKAKDGTLTLDDLRGGTFSVTNGGVFGSLMSTPILNPPQVGILGLHVIKDRPANVGGQIALRPMMYTALTYDHRIVDGSEAVRFLVRVKELVEEPGVLLIES
jgi:2-oxoglutarate dehydrogenase E2 component (dihydrolipoamide succinyltransferase)